MKKELPIGDPEDSKHISTGFIYDERNLMVREIRPEGDVIKYSYDKAANLTQEIDRKGQEINYSYRRDYLPLAIEYHDDGGILLESKEYSYDRNGNRLTAVRNTFDSEDQTIASSNSITTAYDPLGRIESESRAINGKTYTSSYRYDKVGNITGIKYPGSDTYLEYQYNERNQLVAIDGIADGTVSAPAFSYRDNGFLEGLRYNNGTVTEISPDSEYRIENIEVNRNTGSNDTLLDISYRYDENNNVTKRINNQTGNTNQYHYDELDRLVSTDLEGTFYGERTGDKGYAEEDILRNKALRVEEDYFIHFDYMANSVGVKLLENVEIGKLVLTPSPGVIDHRVNKDTISIHYSDNNFDYHEVPKEDWTFEKDEEGRVTIVFKETVSAVAIKVHSNYDDRDIYNEYVDLSTFQNSLDEIIRVYQRVDEGKIGYEYDAGGNRTERNTIVGNDDTTLYDYYEDSNRLKKANYVISGETYKERYYIYDENGNLTGKGNKVTENPDGSLSLVKNTPSSVYWEYEYTADNRLIAAYYKGKLQAEYSYDADGKRIVSDTEVSTTYFVFNFAGKAIFEESVSTDIEDSDTQTSFIYAFTRQIARVEGVIGGDGEVIYYHHDNLGSTRLMTDESGEVVFDQDYLPFGGDLAVVGNIEPQNDVDEGYKYTGQREEVSIGLYYYGARFYDPEIGRFITEDTYWNVKNMIYDKNNVPSNEVIRQSGNLYVYTMNNPMKYVDPTGYKGLLSGLKDLFKGIKGMLEYNNFMVDYQYTVHYNSILTNPRLSDDSKREILSGLSNTVTDRFLNKYDPTDFKHYITYDVENEDLIRLEQQINEFIDDNAYDTEGLVALSNMSDARDLSSMAIASEGIGQLESFSKLGTYGNYEFIANCKVLQVSIALGIKLNGIHVEDIDAYREELRKTFGGE